MRLLAHSPFALRLAARIGPTRAARDRVRAEALLGPRHELVRLLRAVETTIGQMLGVAALIVLWAAVNALPGTVGVAAAGALVEAGLACRLAVLRLNRRDACRGLIIASRGRLPLAVLDREMRRLQSARCREQLARLLEAIPATAGQRYGCSAGSLVSRGVVSGVAPWLGDVANVIRSGDCSVRGVALAERLVTGPSPLYGPDPDLLRRELGRIRMLLNEPSDQPRPAEPS